MILVFGSINLDTRYELDELPTPGRTVIGRTALVQPGGKGANQAVAAARDGARVAMAGAVGDDAAAEKALAGLKAAGINLSRVARVEAETGSAAICVDRDGQNQIAVAGGANLLLNAEQVTNTDLHPHTTLIVQMEGPADQTAALIRRARKRGARIILNLAPAAPIAADALGMVDWLVVNADEAGWLGEHIGTAANPASLHAALGAGVVRTRGPQGTSATNADGNLFVDALQIEVADTTGAGDCFIGVFAAALDRGANLSDALRRANVAAALSCTRRGSQASLPSRDEIDAALPDSPKPTDKQREIQD